MADVTTTAPSLPLVPGRWALDPFHSQVAFSIRHLGVSHIRGHFRTFDAELVVGPDAASTSVTATIALGSIDTGNADRDAHVLVPEFLDVERRPTLAFRSTTVRGVGADWQVDGELSLGDVTRPITLAVELGGLGDFRGERHAGFDARAELRRDEFAVDFGPGDVMLGKVVKIQLDLQFVEPTG